MTDNEMPPETLEALRGSIQKWERICYGCGVDKGADNCPLCLLCEGCEGCPSDCDDETDYADWYELTEYQSFREPARVESRVTTPVEAEAAECVLNHLISLLPEGIEL